ncbi:Rv1733c family protein [Streptomyces zhihengii]|uniref:Rv1733c family protein n=1 Tax=Streptomyces zhihengii TaxID=1818004 RepID=UPI0033A035B4
MRAAAGIWRWRRNPLCRPTDMAEAWLALVAVLLFVTAAPAVGWVTGTLTDEALRGSVRLQLQQRHPVTAQVTGPAPAGPAGSGDESTAAEEHRRVLATWTSPDGRVHTGTVTTSLRTPRPGDRFTVWTDASGRRVPRPMDRATARVHAVLAGTGASALTALLVECTRRMVLWRLTRRRHARLDRAWAATGPDWGRAGAGS